MIISDYIISYYPKETKGLESERFFRVLMKSRQTIGNIIVPLIVRCFNRHQTGGFKKLISTFVDRRFSRFSS